MEEWRDVLSIILADSDFDRNSNPKSISKENKMLQAVIDNGEPSTVHCECLLVAYLDEYSTPAPFNYIAVSKLSCKPCYFFVQAYNTITGRNFQTRGSHDKWYSGWVRPALADEQLQVKVDGKFVGLVEEELCGKLDGQNVIRNRCASDSSASSETHYTSFGLSQEESDTIDLLALKAIGMSS